MFLGLGLKDSTALTSGGLGMDSDDLKLNCEWVATWYLRYPLGTRPF